MKPILLDCMCGAGGTAKGYQEAGFYVVGVDIKPQPNYVGDRFIQCDALAFLEALAANPGVEGINFVAAHASPPCQAHTDLQKQSKRTYPELIAPTRELLRATGLPYVIENVEGAPLVDPVRICGASVPGLRVIRHRLFETNFPLEGIPCPDLHPPVFTYDKRKTHYGRLCQRTAYLQVTGGGNCKLKHARDAMGIDWMTKEEINQAIPPAYARHVGEQLLVHVESETRAAA